MVLKRVLLYLDGSLGFSIPPEIVRLIVFVILDSYRYNKSISIACGDDHSMILTNDHTLFKIENNNVYSKITSIDQIFAGGLNSFVLKDKKLYGAIDDSLFEFLERPIIPSFLNFQKIYMSLKAYNAQEINGFKSIYSGYKCIFLLTTEGFFGLGENSNGQLGLGINLFRVKGFKKINLTNVTYVTCGFQYTIALTTEGLFSCGKNSEGQLGLGDQLGFPMSDHYSFTKINIQNVIAVECGYDHSLTLTTDGLYACGGDNSIRPFLNPYSKCSIFQKGNIQNVVSFKCGKNFSLILTHDGLFGCGRSRATRFYKDVYDMETFFKIQINNVISFDCGMYHTIIETKEGFFYDQEETGKEYTFTKIDLD